MTPTIHRLATDDAARLRGMLDVFAEAFDDADQYAAARPGDEYLTRLLGSSTFIALVAMDGDAVVGGLTAYELVKPERATSEIYIDDLAVRSTHRRRGLATALIAELRRLGAERGAWVIFVQADTAPDDEPARTLYSRLGVREEVLHFDIPVG